MLIEQSIAAQYGVLPSRQEDLPWADWGKLVGGLMEDTPLGRVVGIRAERDPDAIRRFTPGQKQIRAEWAAFRLSRNAGSGAGSLEGIKRRQRALQAGIAAALGR